MTLFDNIPIFTFGIVHKVRNCAESIKINIASLPVGVYRGQSCHHLLGKIQMSLRGDTNNLKKIQYNCKKYLK